MWSKFPLSFMQKNIPLFGLKLFHCAQCKNARRKVKQTAKIEEK